MAQPPSTGSQDNLGEEDGCGPNPLHGASLVHGPSPAHWIGPQSWCQIELYVPGLHTRLGPAVLAPCARPGLTSDCASGFSPIRRAISSGLQAWKAPGGGVVATLNAIAFPPPNFWTCEGSCGLDDMAP